MSCAKGRVEVQLITPLVNLAESNGLSDIKIIFDFGRGGSQSGGPLRTAASNLWVLLSMSLVGLSFIFGVYGVLLEFT
jgi:hypothetical protein